MEVPKIQELERLFEWADECHEKISHALAQLSLDIERVRHVIAEASEQQVARLNDAERQAAGGIDND